MVTIGELISMFFFHGSDACVATATALFRLACQALLQALPRFVSSTLPDKPKEQVGKVVDRTLIQQIIAASKKD